MSFVSKVGIFVVRFHSRWEHGCVEIWVLVCYFACLSISLSLFVCDIWHGQKIWSPEDLVTRRSLLVSAVTSVYSNHLLVSSRVFPSGCFGVFLRFAEIRPFYNEATRPESPANMLVQVEHCLVRIILSSLLAHTLVTAASHCYCRPAVCLHLTHNVSNQFWLLFLVSQPSGGALSWPHFVTKCHLSGELNWHGPVLFDFMIRACGYVQSCFALSLLLWLRLLVCGIFVALNVQQFRWYGSLDLANTVLID